MSAALPSHPDIEGEVPSPLNPPPGCYFHPRSPSAMAQCSVDLPVLQEVTAGHWVPLSPVLGVNPAHHLHSPSSTYVRRRFTSGKTLYFILP